MVFGILTILHLALAGVHTAHYAHTLAQASQSDSDERNTYAARRERTAARGREQARHYVIVANGNEHRTVERQSSSEWCRRHHTRPRFPQHQLLQPATTTGQGQIPLHEEEEEYDTMHMDNPPRRNPLKKILRRLKATCLCCASGNKEDEEPFLSGSYGN